MMAKQRAGRRSAPSKVARVAAQLFGTIMAALAFAGLAVGVAKFF